MNQKQLLKFHFESKPEKLRLVRELVKNTTSSIGCNPELCEKLVIAVNEACMNVIQHADHGEYSGEIILEILNNEGQLLFRLEDNASPMDLESAKPRDLNEIRPGGLGIHFIREIMDDYVMGHLKGETGNYLEMRKRIDDNEGGAS